MAPRTSPRRRARVVLDRLAAEYPGTARDLCALRHRDAFELLVATILSAQCTDERVNLVTPAVFARFPDPASLAEAPVGEVEELVRSTGFFRAKASSLVGMARGVEDRFGGEVPSAMEAVTALPGVGRKTANVVRSVAFGLPGLPVDTHVGRIVRRLGLTAQTDPVKVEADLDALVPADERGAFSLRLILHGRAVCKARTPDCAACVLADVCPSAGDAVRPARGAAPARRAGSAGRGSRAGAALAGPARRSAAAPSTAPTGEGEARAGSRRGAGATAAKASSRRAGTAAGGAHRTRASAPSDSAS